jgi:YegS/Rv2252/BmrU family lipid kinase
MARAFVIFNPAARGEKNRRVQRFLEAKAAGDPAWTLAPTSAPGHAKQLAARAVADGYELIVAAGGDGTINEAINGIATSGVPLAIVPLGTANVFARELGIPRNLYAAWHIVTHGKPRSIDLACADAGGAKRYFAQLAGVGFDASAVQRASWELKKKIGPLSYIWAGLQTLAHPMPAIEVSVNGRGTHSLGPAVLIGNGRYYGGGFGVFPQAKLDDGLLDVCMFGNCGFLDVLRYTQGVFRGVHTKFRDVHYFQTSELLCSPALCLQRAGPVLFEVDGELAGETPVRFSVSPRALRVLVPNTEGGIDHA